MSDDFLKDLDDFFGKTYTDFDLISAMPSYESVTISMILKNKNRIEEGQIASNEMRKIAWQPQKDAVLAELKERLVDNSFSFSFRPARPGGRIRAFFGSKNHGGALLAAFIRKYGEDPDAAAEHLGLREEVWKGLRRGKFVPEKQLLFRAMLLYGFSREDGAVLLRACDAYYDFACVRDVVVCYLVSYRILNPEMIGKAFDEYRLRRIL